MRSPSAEQIAKIGITIQFLALVRCLSEYFRLKWVRVDAVISGAVEPFVVGGLIAAVGAWIAVTCFFLRRYKAASVVAAVTVSSLIAYRLSP